MSVLTYGTWNVIGCRFPLRLFRAEGRHKVYLLYLSDFSNYLPAKDNNDDGLCVSLTVLPIFNIM